MLQGQRAELQKELSKLDKAITVLSELSGSTPTPLSNGSCTGNGGSKKHTMSAAARKRIGQAQKARWAKIKGNASAPAAKAPAIKTAAKATRPKGITAAGRKALSVAMKKRWAKRAA